MAASHEVILVAGVLCLLAAFAGLISARIGTPLLLGFIGVGMLAGEDGPGGIQFDNFQTAYLVGSLALAIILFEGGLSTERAMIRRALWPALALATAGVAISAVVVGAAVVLMFQVRWPDALLLGAVTAPTDAAAVSVLLRLSRAAVPARVAAALEIESGLNDPMSVFLTVSLVEALTTSEGIGLGHAALLFLLEMGGGAAIGLVGGYVLLWLFRHLHAARSVFPVFAVGGALTIFGGAQVVGASGFLAAYLAGVIIGIYDHPAGQPVTRFFETLGWLAQITLFLMLGLLITPHELPPYLLRAVAVSAVLIVLARPAGVMTCLLPLRWTVREAAFVAWSGLRGAVPIYLTIIPLLTGVATGETLFKIVFVVVIVSVAVQGSTMTIAARLLGLKADDGAAPAC
ncbi:MAG TPA: potassium/proton antiporter [Stellaceae bacterium]|nr:potassium/proton antiporter [Stellaceae bacterium]